MYVPGPKRFQYWEVFGVFVLRYHELFDWTVYYQGKSLPIEDSKTIIEAAGYNW
jgi:hypothetical protein